MKIEQFKKDELFKLASIEQFIFKNSNNLNVLLNGIVDMLPPLLSKEHIFMLFSINNEEFKDNNSDYAILNLIFQSEIAYADYNFGKLYIYSDSSNLNLLGNKSLAIISYFVEKVSKIIFELHLKQEIELQEDKQDITLIPKPEWSVILDIIRKTDQNLYSILSRKMLNFLYTKGIKESQELYEKMGSNLEFDSNNPFVNRPSKKTVMMQSFIFGLEIYEISANYFSDDEILNRIQKWINEEKSHYLIKLLANTNSSMSDISDAIRKYHNIKPQNIEEHSPLVLGINVSLIRRFLTDSLDFIDIAKNYCEIEDFYNIINKTIFPPESHGKVGGKSAGLFLAKKIIEKNSEFYSKLKKIKVPKTWYVTSDGLNNFMYYNNMEDVIEQKYKSIEEIRKEYPYIIQAFKNAQFSPEVLNGLARALDDFGTQPIIVRSSSLLEDRLDSVFAGKYKSLFLANQGTKQERLDELISAISEIYASIFAPDPIGYRTERGLLDFNEEMGIIIQEVVGQKVGNYFFPAFAGVAFSLNEFRWSPRINREDGLLRLVVGLGTRAVDRLGNDFPILISPGNPNLRVNQTFEEIVNYSPQYIDVINLKKNSFETISIKSLLDEVGEQFPIINDLFSIVDAHYIKQPVGIGINLTNDDVVVTFDKLIQKKEFIENINLMLEVLSENFDGPVDIEFACDGNDLYLLQCRPQASSKEAKSAKIPENIPQSEILFAANKFISNAQISDLYYIVYVDPDNYKKTEELSDLYDIGKAVGLLNKKLPKKSFILMGPGRWGSRDDIRLGVKITYSDIHNTSVLMEIAKKNADYTPDLSFGTHFFQDLVETGIKYIPLYPDEENNFLNEELLMSAENTLTRYLPEYDHIANTLRVINVRELKDGKILRILLNGEEGRALAFFSEQDYSVVSDNSPTTTKSPIYDDPLSWRKRMAESIALKLDNNRFGVKEMYLYGTVFNETAGANSDVDLLIRFDGNEQQKNELMIWFEGWNHSLSQINYNRSGYDIQRFLDVLILNDNEIEEQKYYRDLIDPANRSAKKLKLMNDNE